MSKLNKLVNIVSFFRKNLDFKSLFFIVSILTYGLPIFSQVTISGGSTVNGSYTSIANAVNALNGATISGPVVVDIVAGHSETAPVGGIILTATGTVANTITFQKSGAGVNPLINAYVGTNTPASVGTDGMFILSGSDFVTIDGIDLFDGNTASPTEMMECGYGLFKVDGTNGCQNNIIKNCVITLNRNSNAAWTVGHNGSIGITINNTTYAAKTALTVTSSSGSNSGNKFYTNTIQNCNAGIVFIGFAATSPFTLGDTGNDVGGTSAATGNTIINFGGATGATNPATGIFANNQWGFNGSRNTINNNNGSGINHVTTLRAIFLNSSSTSASADCNFNTITVKSSATTSQASGIENGFGSTAASNTININNNSITGEYLTSTTGSFYGIYNNAASPAILNMTNNTISNIQMNGSALTSGVCYGIWNSGTATTLNINNNLVTNINYGNLLATSTGAVYPIYNSISSATSTFNILNNTVSNVVRLGSSGGTTIGIYSSTGTTGQIFNVNGNSVSNMSIDGAGTASTLYGIQVSTGTISVNNNTVNNLSVLKTSGTGSLYGIYDISSPVNETYSNNTISNLTHFGTGTVYGLYAFTTTGVRTVSQNTVFNLSTVGTTIGGINMSSSVPTVTRNKIYNITSNSTGAPTVFGIQITSTTAGTSNINNNIIGDLKAPFSNSTAATSPSIRGINITTTTASTTLEIAYNTVHLNATSSGTNFSTAAIFATTSTTATTATLNLRNNILSNLSTPKGTGLTVAYQRSSTSLTNYGSVSDRNLFYAGLPCSSRLIYYDGTNALQTLASYKALATLAPRDANSITEDPKYSSLVGSSSSYLHINPSIPTLIESAAGSIASITIDYDGDTRNASTPDIGADEFTGTVATACTGTPTAGTATATPNPICSGQSSNICLTGQSTGTGITIQWQSATTSGGPYTAISCEGASCFNTGALTPGTYYYTALITCTNSGLTALSNEVVLVVNSNPTAAISPTSVSICSGNSTTLTASGGTNYLWSTGAITNPLTVSPTTATTYTVTVSDAIGCTATATSVVTVLPIPIVSASATPNQICFGGSSQLDVNVNLGFPPYTITPLTGITYDSLQGTGITIINTTSQLLTGFASGTQDDGGVVVNIPFNFTYMGSSFNQISFCTNGWIGAGNWGTIDATNSRAPANLFTNTIPNNTIAPWFRDMGGNFGTTGVGSMRHGLVGTDVYAFQWNRAVGSSFSETTTNTISFQVNIFGPASSSPGRIEYIYGPQLGTLSTGASIGIENAIGGTGNYLNAITNSSNSTTTSTAWPGNGTGYAFVPTVTTYSWSPSTFLNNTTIQNPIATNVNQTTTYTVTVTSPNGCTATSSVNVTVNPTISLTVSETSGLVSNDSIICAGSSATLTASGGTTYSWSSGETTSSITVNPVITTTYTVTVSDGTCTGTKSITITVNPKPIVSIVPNPASICLGGNINLTASGGTSYSWSTGQTINPINVAPIVTTTYIVTATDANACSDTASRIVTVYPIPVAVITPTSATICSGQSQLLTASGGLTYIWNTGATTDTTTVSPSTTTTYIVTVTAAGNCTDTETVTVTVNPVATISGTLVQPTTCVSLDGTITITIGGAVGPYSFNWATPNGSGLVNGQQSQSGLSVGTYTVTVTAGNGCTSTASYTLTGPGGCSICPTIGSFSSNVSSSCKDEPFTLTASGLTDMGSTYGITFKYSTTVLTDPYTGGTVLGTVSNGSLTGGGTIATLTTSLNTPGTYYIYAILSVLPLDPSCRPSSQITMTIYSCSPTITDPCSCKNNATTLTDGQFNETITVNAPAGQTWTVTAVTGLYQSSSPAPPAAPLPIAVGTVLTASGTTYTLTGVHVDALGYTITVSNGTTSLSIGNTCYYPNPAITGLNGGYCLYDSPVTLTGSAQLGDGSGPATGVGTFTVNGVATTQFNPGALGTGTHTVQYCFDAADGVPSPAHPGCIQCMTQSVVVNPTPTVNAVANQAYCNGQVAPITAFSGTPVGVTFSWTNNNTAIGLGASGTGNLPSFTATNGTTAPITATITVTPSYTNAGVTCTGTAITFTITVNPSPTVASQTNKFFCSGLATGGIVFSGTPTGVVFNWTNSNTAIGIGASGTGNIPTWTPINNTTLPIVGTITVTPSYTNGGVTCTGTAITFTVTIYPAPQAICKNFTLNLDANGNGILNPSDINNGSVGGRLTISKTNFNCNNLGANNVTLTVSDSCGQTSSCVAVVTVADNIAPTITCPPSQVIALKAGECKAAGIFTDPSAKDNCEFAITTGFLTSTYNSNNQFAGNMFNITNVGTSPITITSFEGNVNAAAGTAATFQVFYTTTATTYVGNTNNAGAWTSMGTANAVCAGVNQPTIVPIGGLVLQPGETKGIYFVLTSYGTGGQSLRYTNGNNTYNNGDLRLDAGIGKANPNFTGTNFTSRTWNGTIRYNKLVGAPPIISQIDNTGYKNGDLFPKGTTCLVYQAKDYAGNLSATCQVCIEVRGIVNPTSTMTCNDVLNVSLDTNCLALINADMVLEGGPYDCYDDYKVVLTLGNKVVPNPITAEYVGKTLTATVYDKFSPNKCWGLLKIEDKVSPQLVCPSNVTISCGDKDEPGNIGALFPNGLKYGTYEEYTNPLTGVNVYKVSDKKYKVKAGIIDRCTEVSLSYVDIVQEYSCSATTMITKVITRKWSAIDLYGNSSNCSQVISVRRAVLSELVMPLHWDGQAGNHRVLNICRDLYTGNPLDYRHNDSAWVKLSNGYPSPKAGAISVDTIYVGEFDGSHDPLNPGTDTLILRGTGMPSGATCSTINMLYTDTKLEVCGTGYKLLRDWRILDWCTGQIRNYTQLIKVVDMTAPVLECPADLTASTEGVECKGSGTFPIPVITDVCSKTSYEVYYNGGTAFPEGGYVGQNPDGSWRYAGFPCGTYNFKYVAKDECGNISECTTFDLILRDITVPVAVCRTLTQVTLTNTADDPNTVAKECGLTKVESNKFDEGSWDNCGGVYFKARRSNTNNPGVYDNDPRFDDIVWFNCEDVGKEIEVILRVYDVQPIVGHVGSVSDRGDSYKPTRTDGCGPVGNYNDCVVKVRVEDLVNPTISCPPQVNITCTAYDFSIPLTNVDTSWFNKYLGKVVSNDCNGTNVNNGTFTYYNGFGQVTGANGSAFDNCFVSIPQTITSQMECGVGTITRTFRAIDRGGRQSTACTQLIVVTNPTPFSINATHYTDPGSDLADPCDGAERIRVGSVEDFNNDLYVSPNFSPDNIIWPDKVVELTNCTGISGVGTECSNTGKDAGHPRLTRNDKCDLVGITHTDEVFELEPNVCVKILRHWTVIDWCQDKVNGKKWYYTQVIKLVDKVAPDFTGNTCKNDTICQYPTDCGPDALTMTATAKDNCTPEANLKYSYFIDLNNNGTNDLQGKSSGFSITKANGLGYGRHMITWAVEDNCGNVKTCSKSVEIKDCKKPTPVSKLLTIELMPNNCQATLEAVKANNFSWDNCTPMEKLRFRLAKSGDYRADMTLDEVLNLNEYVIFTEGELGTQTIALFVIDEDNNWDYVETFIVVQSNMNPNCGGGGGGSASISGTIQTEGKENIDKVEIKVNGSTKSATDAQGFFKMLMELKKSYEIKPEKLIEIRNGVTTADLVAINKHILTVEELKTPYKRIAADINNDGKISTADMVELRKIILYINDNFSNNTSWKMVDKSYVFQTATPEKEAYPLKVEISPLQGASVANFVGVKIGDVNGTAKANAIIGDASERSAGTLVFDVQDAAMKAGETRTVEFKAQDIANINAYQFTMNFDREALEVVSVGGLNENNFGLSLLNKGSITLSNDAAAAEQVIAVTFKAKQTVQLSNVLSVGSNYTAADAYTVNGDKYDVALSFNGTIAGNFQLLQNQPNPFSGKTVIGFVLPEATTATMTIFDATGRTMKVVKGDYAKGYNEIVVEKSELNTVGILSYRLTTDKHSATKQMIITE